METGINTENNFSNLYNLFTCLTRDLTNNKFVELSDKIRDEYNTTLNKEIYINYVCMAFYTRDIIQGLGERELFYWFINELIFKEWNSINFNFELFKLMGEYGCWHDLYRFWEKRPRNIIYNKCVEYYLDQLLDDDINISKGEKISLASKWMPRENSKYSYFFKSMIEQIKYDDEKYSHACKRLRRLIVKLTEYTNVVETLMCSNNFSKIIPSTVPSIALKKYKKTFLNNTSNDDRINCSNNFKKYINNPNKKLNGKRLRPDEIINMFPNEPDIMKLLEKQWDDIKNDIKNKEHFKDIITIADFSGSMYRTVGNTISISIAKGLAILIAQLSGYNKFMSFSETPNWIDFSKYNTLTDIIKYINENEELSSGLSTNFEAVYRLILNEIKQEKIKHPKMIICITDMGFNQASNNNNNNNMIDEFCELGIEPPKLIIWNVSAEYRGEYQHSSNNEYVYTISGWSQNILKNIISGEDIISKLKNPENTMIEIIRNDRYKKIIDIFNF